MPFFLGDIRMGELRMSSKDAAQSMRLGLTAGGREADN